jgi:hypothetical protein
VPIAGTSTQGILQHSEPSIDPFVTQLARLCATERTRVKWAVAPAHGLGRTRGERIALAGTDWLNLRFLTPLDIGPPAPRSSSSAASTHPGSLGSRTRARPSARRTE